MIAGAPFEPTEHEVRTDFGLINVWFVTSYNHINTTKSFLALS